MSLWRAASRQNIAARPTLIQMMVAVMVIQDKNSVNRNKCIDSTLIDGAQDLISN